MKTAITQAIEIIELRKKQVGNIDYRLGLQYSLIILNDLLDIEKNQIRLARLEDADSALDPSMLIDLANDYYNETYEQ